MSAGQLFIDPNAYNHLQIPVQQALSNPPPTIQPSGPVAARTRYSTRSVQINATNHLSEPELLEVQRFEDPNAPNPGEKGDLEYEGPGKKRKKKGGPKAAKVALSTAQHDASQIPVASVRSLPTPSLSTPACPNLPSSFTAPHAPPTQSHFQSLASSSPLNHASQTIAPTTTQGYTTVYTQPLVSTVSSGTSGFTVPPSPAVSTVPIGLWSNSSSPHGQILAATFHQSSPIVNPTPPPAHSGFNQSALTPTPGGVNQVEPTFGESDEEDEDEDEDREDEFGSISLSAPITSTNSPVGATADGLGAHVAPARHPNQAFTRPGPFGEATNTVTSQSDLNGADVNTGDDDDVLESLRNKTKRRRRPHTRLGNSVNASAPDSEQAPLDRLDADLTNLNAYDEHERPFLHLARVVYGALLVTREAMPLPGTALKFQIEAYEEAGRLLKQGRPPTLPLKPHSPYIRLIAKHGPTARGRLKTAALNAVLNDYGIKDGRAEPEVVAIRVGKLLDRKNFTFRELTDQGRRAGIFRHPAIANVLISTLFRDRDSDGVLVKHLFLPLIPEEAIFMACIAIEHALEMWSSGVKVPKDFTNDFARRGLWNRHKATWHDHIERKAEQGEAYARETREIITSQIRAVLAGLAPAPGAAASSMPAETESFFDEQDGD